MTFVESIKIENGLVHNLSFHQERIYQTAFLHYGTKPEIKIDVSLIPLHLQKERIKCRVLYAADITAVEYHAYRLREIKSLRIVEDNSVEYRYKTVNRDCLNSLFEQRNGADDIIIVKNGKITDSSSANVVFESFDGELFTPKTYLLAGTKRAFLLKNGIIKEREIAIDDLPLYRKVYLINAMIDLEDNVSVPVSSIIV